MPLQQSNPAAAIAHHLPVQPQQCSARMITNANPRRQEAGKAGPSDPMIQLYILAGIELLVEEADAVVLAAAVGVYYFRFLALFVKKNL